MENIKYHYTSVEGMASIFSNKNLRLTRSEFLNDPADCKVLYSLIEKHLKYKYSNMDALLETPQILELYKKAPLIDYISFLQKNIHLYVLSLTGNSDQMSMWNYYGSGGVQLSVDVDELVESFSRSLADNDYYIAYSPVKYISDRDTADSIVFEQFSNFHLDNKEKKNIFSANSKRKGRSGGSHPLYQTTELVGFIDTYIKGYIESLKFLLNEGEISAENTNREIFEAVYNNTNSLDNYYEFKKDLTLYLIVLSALIKSDTYSYENEFRIVFFENSLSQKNRIKYTVQSLQAQKYMKPYMETEKFDIGFIKGVTLSPLTRNLPIDSELYAEIISEFILSTTGTDISVNWSKHKIRW